MNNSGIWNSVAKWGLLIGLFMSCSRIIEQQLILSGEVGKIALLAVEWLVSAALFCSLLYRAVSRSAYFLTVNDRYSYGRGVNFAVLISIFAAVLVAVSSYIYIDLFVGGFSIYIEQSVASLRSVIAQAEISGEMRESYELYFNEILDSAESEPTIFSALISQVSTYIFTGGIVGLVISWIVARKHKQTDNIESTNEQ